MQGPETDPAVALSRRPRLSREVRLLVILAVVLALGWLTSLLSSILMPFLLGAAIAYFLDPLADRLEAAGFGRPLATCAILGAFFALAVLVVILLLPLLQDQILALAARVPAVIEGLRTKAGFLLESLQSRLGEAELQKISDAASGFAGTVVKWAADLLKRVLSGGLAVFNVLSLLVITPVVAFYMLRDWDHMVARVDELLPRDFAPVIRAQAAEMDRTLAAFLRGQSLVCLTLAIWYSLGLMVLGLDFGLLVGIGAGIISFIPYIGATVGLVTGVGLALHQFADVTQVVLVAAVFIVGQIAESYVLSPRMVGGRVGLHPVWLMFALMAGGALFGFTGVLLAVPVAALLGVLIRFTLSRYRDSALYHGHGDDD